jgi:hypothetical protein
MADKVINTFGPTAIIVTAGTNIYNQGSALIYDILRGIIVCNKLAPTCWLTMYLGLTGGTAAGTELMFQMPFPGNATTPFMFPGNGLKIVTTQFLTGNAQTTLSLVVTGVGVQCVV